MPKIIRLGGLTVGISVALLALLAGCKTECKRGRSECVSDSLIRTCVPTNNGNEWLISQCGASELCSANGAVATADAGSGSTAKTDSGTASTGDGGVKGSASGLTAAASNGAACVGTCTSGEKQCVSDALSKVCINGGVWSLNPCDVGKKCDSTSGECKLSSGAGTVQACTPGALACSGDKQEKVCNADGTAWTSTACLAGLVCTKDHCVPDPKASCDRGPVCIDNKTAARCLGTDKGFEAVPCPGDTYCEGNQCRGPVCALGAKCTGATGAKPSGTGYQECVDGKSYKNTQCKVTEVCQQDGDKASCVPQQCTLNAVVCGDPRDTKVDRQKFFTMCQSSTAFPGSAPGVPGWVQGECAAPTTCSPLAASTAPVPPPPGFSPCTATCTPGEQICTDAPTVDPTVALAAAQAGISTGIAECGADGKWGPPTSCNTGTAAALMCAPVYSLDPSKLPKAVCAAPVCAYWLNMLAGNKGVLTGVTTKLGTTLDGSGFDGNQGACSADKLLACGLDGKLATTAAACAKGFCSDIAASAQDDGRTPGACPSPVTPECTTGEQQCLVLGGGKDGAYRACVGGFWSSTVQACTGSNLCFDTVTMNMRSTFCGADCAPGMHRCDPATPAKIETCTSAGKWPTAGTACAAGACTPRSSGGSINDAVCALECVPGQVGCAGSTSQIKCKANGTWDTATACVPDPTSHNPTSCRQSGTGLGLGCLQCVGPSVTGGNEQGVTDTQCDPNAATKLQQCGTDNKWKASTACTNSCVQGSPNDTCGSCAGVDGTTTLPACTQSAIQTEYVCDSCIVHDPNNVSLTTTVPHCTQTAINGAYAGETCATQSFGTPTSIGNTVGCCSFYVTQARYSTAYMSVASCVGQNHGTPGYFGGYTGCCADAQIHASTYAYCN